MITHATGSTSGLQHIQWLHSFTQLICLCKLLQGFLCENKISMLQDHNCLLVGSLGQISKTDDSEDREASGDKCLSTKSLNSILWLKMCVLVKEFKRFVMFFSATKKGIELKLLKEHHRQCQFPSRYRGRLHSYLRLKSFLYKVEFKQNKSHGVVWVCLFVCISILYSAFNK